MQESCIDDYWNIDGSRDLSDSWTGFTHFTLLVTNLLKDICGPGGDWQKRQATSRPDHLWPELWRGMARNAKLREKRKWAIEKPKLVNARRLQGIYFIDREDKEFKETIKECKKNWKHQWLQPRLARDARKASMERPAARPMISSLNLRVCWKPVNPQECVWKNLYQHIMRTILQEEGTIHYNITIWYTNLFLCLKQWRYRQQKQQWIKNGRNLKRSRRGTEQKSETNQRWSMTQGQRAEKFILPHWWTSVIWRMPNWRQGTTNFKVEL